MPTRKINRGVLRAALYSWIVLLLLSIVSAENPYDNSYIDNTNWFNSDALNPMTTRGLFTYFFLALLLFALIVYAEMVKIPILYLCVGVFSFFYSILLFATISSILGAIMIVFSFLTAIRGVMILAE